MVFKTKQDLAIELIKEIYSCGVEYVWIGADLLYGQSYQFAGQIENLGKKFVLDVKKDQHVYTEKPIILTEQKRKKISYKIINDVLSLK